MELQQEMYVAIRWRIYVLGNVLICILCWTSVLSLINFWSDVPIVVIRQEETVPQHMVLPFWQNNFFSGFTLTGDLDLSLCKRLFQYHLHNWNF